MRRILLASLLVLTACSSSGDRGSTDGTANTASALPATDATPASTQVTVFAASSLTDAFDSLTTAFEAEHPGITVTVNTGASSELAAQILQGAPADVFAAADTTNMQKVVDAGAAADPVTFATNRLAIMVEPSNPRQVTSLADLARPDLAVVLCAPEVPCGRYAAQVLGDAGVQVTPKSLEQNVKAVVTKVTAGEADAGIVYWTDVLAARGAAAGIEIPAELNVTATYPIAVTKDAADAAAAQAFVAFVTSPAGRSVLDGFGFGAP